MTSYKRVVSMTCCDLLDDDIFLELFKNVFDGAFAHGEVGMRDLLELSAKDRFVALRR